MPTAAASSSSPLRHFDHSAEQTAMPHLDTSLDARLVIRLRPSPFAPRRARRFVYEVGDPAGLPAGLVDDAALVTGELVNESIRQSRCDVEVAVATSPFECVRQALLALRRRPASSMQRLPATLQPSVTWPLRGGAATTHRGGR